MDLNNTNERIGWSVQLHRDEILGALTGIHAAVGLIREQATADDDQRTLTDYQVEGLCLLTEFAANRAHDMMARLIGSDLFDKES
ncbi:hypothetical protein [Ectothiorhodospira lacustris]|uniref:hypothetical protein n=1 Tax=Ectothiorhodospira lacustris TaxID=2899127 RepID=UPI001EE845A3|nr:hypothetical protein [Ectothiorhodospira lacustris]MCG5509622.1 hypothetical protein [Ectothiorhodospira lacustris]MCG5521583.1 hypothetical protein [Ectothiorhodospira lacustris]